MKITLLSLKKIYFFFLVFGIMALNIRSTVGSSNYAWFMIIGSSFFYAIIECILYRKIILDIYFFLYLSFVAFSAMSIKWATNSQFAITGVYTCSLTLLIMFSLANTIRSYKDCESVVKAIAWAGVAMFIYFSITYGLFYILTIRLQYDDPEVNANDYGIKCFLSAMCFLFIYMRTCEKKYRIMFVIMLFLATLSGSRKVLVMMILDVFGLYIIRNKKYQFIKIFVAFLLLAIMYYFAMTVPVLYDMIGVRIEESISFFSDKGVADNSSTGIRKQMLDLGVRLFFIKPWNGYGLANAAAFNDGLYLHNNYIELLVDVGIIGALIYYMIIIVAVYKIFNDYRNSESDFSLVLLFILCSFLVTDFFLVSYNKRIIQLFFVLAYRFLSTKQEASTSLVGVFNENGIELLPK